jgi:hypothetical protein
MYLVHNPAVGWVLLATFLFELLVTDALDVR